MHMQPLVKYYSRKFRLEFLNWRKRGWSNPAPAAVKRNVLLRYCISGADWIETGTYLGETACFLATKTHARKVYSLEPSFELFNFNRKKWKKIGNLEVINASSEDGLEKIILQTSGALNFWLDGHNSGDITYLGERISPIEFELSLIAKHCNPDRSLSIFIDDVRLFNGEDGYLTIDQLVNWADQRSFKWTIEHDIFVMH